MENPTVDLTEECNTVRYVRPNLARLLIVLFTITVGVCAALSALVGVTRISRPALALTLDESDASALAADVSAKLAALKTRPYPWGELKREVDQSLRAQALNVKGLAMLASLYELKDEQAVTDQLATVLLKMSRREASTQLFLIEKAVASNDIPRALKQYDTVFRTSLTADALLFPILANALDDETIRRSFVPYVKNDAPWLARFITYSLQNPGGPAIWADMIVRTKGLPKDPGYRALEEQIMFQLAGQGKFVELKKAYLALPGADERRINSLTFAPTGGRSGLVDWQLTNNADVQTGFERDPATGKIEMMIRTAKSGTLLVARKLMLNDKGMIRIRGRYASQSLRLIMSVTCAEAGAQLLLATKTYVPAANGEIDERYEVLKDVCPAQFVDLAVQNFSDGDTDQELRLSALGLSRG